MRAFIKAAAFDRDEAACRALFAPSSLKVRTPNLAPDAHEMVYEYGEVTEENGEWFVPVTVANPKEPNEPPVTMLFAPVLIDGHWKLDMEKMFERTAGVSVIELADGMGEALASAGAAMADGVTQIFRGIPETIGDVFDRSPKIDRIRATAAKREEQLQDIYGVSLWYHIDFDGFTSSPDDEQSDLALSLLTEHGVDAMYYALTELFHDQPSFVAEIIGRVRRVNVLHVTDPSRKQLGFQDDAINYSCNLHQLYDGYLSINDLKEQLPAIVAQMPLINPSWSDAEDVADALPDMSLSPPAAADEEANAFAELRSTFEESLSSYPAMFAQMVGEPITIEIDWDSVGNDAAVAGQILNLCLSPIVGGMLVVGQDPAYRDRVAQHIRRIALTRVRTLDDQSLDLSDGTLTMAVCLMDSEQTATTIKELLVTVDRA